MQDEKFFGNARSDVITDLNEFNFRSTVKQEWKHWKKIYQMNREN